MTHTAGTQSGTSTRDTSIRRPLRVAHIIGFLNIGGAERQLVNLLNAMTDSERLAIFVGQDQGGGDLRPLLEPAIEQVHVPIRCRHLGWGMRDLVTLLRRRSCDVVHTHMFWASLYGTVAARWAGVPVIVTTEHGEDRWKRWYHRGLERHLISRYAARRLCVSESILNRRRAVDGIPGRILQLTANGTVMPNLGHDIRPDAELLIGTVGRFVYEKDYATLIAAAAILRDRGVSFRLCLVGDGPDRAALEQQVAALGLDGRIDFPGAVGDVESWYRRFDIFALSSVQEGLPMALLEAMSYGIPCVATSVGAISSAMASNREGTIVPPRRPDALAESLEAYLKNPELRARHGAAARERIRVEFSIEAVAADHLELYRRLLMEHSEAACQPSGRRL